MLLISDGLFFSYNIRRFFDNSTVGWTLQRRRRRSCRSLPTLLPQLTGLSVGVILVVVLDMCTRSCHTPLLLCLLVCLFPVSPFQRPIIQFLSLAQLSAWQL